MRNGLSIILMAFLLFISCSDSNKEYILDPATGGHYGDWIVGHRANYLEGKIDCRECHGRDLKGGIAGISCFSASFKEMSCHPNGPPVTHPAGWRNPANHGASAKAAPNVTSGFSYCQKCHGSDFSGGKANRPCFTCHGVNAPHPKRPWREDARTHENTNTANASVCFACHSNGSNSTHKPDIPANAGTPAGCFNGTLCHSNEHED